MNKNRELNLATYLHFMLASFKTHLLSNFPKLKKAKILVAISGGIDSVVLTHLFYQLGYNIALAHCNFKLRGAESVKDELFVESLANEYKIDFFSRSFETSLYASKNHLSIQMAARQLRYEWFQEITNKHAFDFVATAHHHNDVLETFIINLTRGTGLDGLCGIPAENGNIVRPLLPFGREEILDFATAQEIAWREDQSNASTKYKRNKIRHQIVPLLKELNPQFLETFKKTLVNLNESRQSITSLTNYFAEKIVNKVGEELHLDCAEIRKLTSPKAFLFQILKDYHFGSWEDVYQLVDAQTGKKIWSSTHQLLKNRDCLILSELKKENQQEYFLIPEETQQILFPIKLKFSCVEMSNFKSFFSAKKTSKNTEFIDSSKITYPMVVRKWQSGDIFYPIGMQGRKKISKFFKDKKLSFNQKRNVWLLLNASGEIIWVIGMRLDTRFKLDEDTESITRITCDLQKVEK